MPFPAVTTEIAFATGAASNPTIADANWKDVSSYVREGATRRGRQRALDRMEPGTATLVLDNRDRRFDPEYSSSPYSPNVVPMRHIRVIAGYQGVVLADKPFFFARWDIYDPNLPVYDQDIIAGISSSNSVSGLGPEGPGQNGTGVYDGSIDYTSYPDTASFDLGTNFTIECWLNIDTDGSEQGLVVRNNVGDANPGVYDLRRNSSNKIVFTTDNGISITSSGSVLASGGWYHVVVTYDNVTARLYINGVADGTDAGAGQAPTANAETLLIGRRGTGSFFDGYLDEVALYNSALSPTRVLDHYNEGAKEAYEGHIFRGFVESWPQRWLSNKDATVTIPCTDGFTALANANLAHSPLDIEIQADLDTVGASVAGHKVWLKFDETDILSSDCRDYSGNDLDFDYGNFSSGKGSSPVPAYGGGYSIQMPGGTGLGTGYDPVIFGNTTGTDPTNASVEVWINPASDNKAQAVVWSYGGSGTAKLEYNGVTQKLHAAIFNGVVGGVNPAVDISLPPAQVYHVIVRINDTSNLLEVYVNGSLAGSDNDSFSALWSGAESVKVGGLGYDEDDGAGDFLDVFSGTIDEFVIYPDVLLSEARIEAHYNAGAEGYAGDTTGARIDRILDEIGWPSTLRDVDTGFSTLGGQAFVGQTALEACQEAADAEFSYFFMTTDGKVRLIGRDKLYDPANTPDYTAVQATFGDAEAVNNAAGNVVFPYLDLVLEHDALPIYNEVKFNRTGGTVLTKEDATSQAQFFARTLEKTLVLEDDDQVEDAAQYTLNEHKDARAEIRAIVFTPMKEAGYTTSSQYERIWEHALKREIGDLIAVKRNPMNVGSEISKDVRIQSIAHSFAPGRWITTWEVDVADTDQYWILGDSTLGVLGSTTVLAF